VVKVTFRLIAATNRSLDDEVKAGRFREDLYYRLNVVKLVVPPLRERREDILPLFDAYLRRFAADQGAAPPVLTTSVTPLVEQYAWPGNVRELRNLAERLSIFAGGRELTPADFPPNFLEGGAVLTSPLGGLSAAAGASIAPRVEGGTLDLQALERQAIQRALEQFQGNRSAAAEALGISRRTLQRKLKEYRLAEEEPEV
jgi:DNA-binding NtrC family response regulator